MSRKLDKRSKPSKTKIHSSAKSNPRSRPNLQSLRRLLSRFTLDLANNLPDPNQVRMRNPLLRSR